MMITDSIPKGIRITELNSFITNDKTKMVSFPGTTSEEILHYINVHLTNSSVHNVILHIGVNDLLEDNNRSKMENLGKNLKFMVGKSNIYGFKNVFITA